MGDGSGFLAHLLAPLLLLGAASAAAQPPWDEAIRLEPFPAVGNLPAEVRVETVHNYYGRCGPAMVHVLGVRDQVGDFFTINATDSARVVVIGEGRRSTVVDDRLSDHNGVACLAGGRRPYVLVWHRCGGSACGDDFQFTVIDARRARIVAGADGECDERCAARITGSPLPEQLNRR